MTGVETTYRPYARDEEPGPASIVPIGRVEFYCITILAAIVCAGLLVASISVLADTTGQLQKNSESRARDREFNARIWHTQADWLADDDPNAQKTYLPQMNELLRAYVSGQPLTGSTPTASTTHP